MKKKLLTYHHVHSANVWGKAFEYSNVLLISKITENVYEENKTIYKYSQSSIVPKQTTWKEYMKIYEKLYIV